MGLNIPIPKELSHLKIDERGYPIPFFVPIVDGKPNFRYLDERRQLECIERRLCGICGKKLYKDFQYFLSGPKGLYNQVASDPPMHRVCAEFAIISCPHLYYQQAERKTEHNPIKDWYLGQDKPDTMFMVKVDHYRTFRAPVNNKTIFQFRPVAIAEYVYKNGVLEFVQEMPYKARPF